MNIYLDVDGVLITKYAQPAEGIREFLDYVTSHYPTYWLTTHCRNGGNNTLEYIQSKGISNEVFALLEKIIPTDWDVLKSEAIDYSQDFLWFDDSPLPSEMSYLKEKGKLDNFIFVDLNKNPKQLLDFVRDFPLPR